MSSTEVCEKIDISWEIFTWIVRKHHGICKVKHIMKYFPSIQSEDDLLVHVVGYQNFFLLWDSASPVESIVRTRCPKKVRLCFEYYKEERCTNTTCSSIHVCHSKLYYNQCTCLYTSNCLHREANIDTRLGGLQDNELCVLLRNSFMTVCTEYNTAEGCTNMTRYHMCPYVHICVERVRGDCNANDECLLNHSPLKDFHYKDVYAPKAKTAKSLMKKVLISPNADILLVILAQSGKRGISRSNLALRLGVNRKEVDILTEAIAEQVHLYDRRVVLRMSVFQICPYYITGTKCSCRNLSFHVCAVYVLSGCCRLECALSHDLLDAHNKKLFLKNKCSHLSTELRRRVLLISALVICDTYTTIGTCLDKDCCNMHVCGNLVTGECTSEVCAKEHALGTPHNVAVKSLHDMNFVDDSDLKMTLAATLSINATNQPQGCVNEKEMLSLPCIYKKGNSLIHQHAVDGKNGTLMHESKANVYDDYDDDDESESDDMTTNVIPRQTCDVHDIDKTHSDQGVNVDVSNADIKRADHSQNVSNQGLKWTNMDQDSPQTDNAEINILSVSTHEQNTALSMHNIPTIEICWSWFPDVKTLQQYGINKDHIQQDLIEARYQEYLREESAGIIIFKAGVHLFELNFSTMTQINLTTDDTSLVIRHRTLDDCEARRVTSFVPEDLPNVVPDPWSPMDTRYPFQGDMVALNAGQKEFQKVVNKFLQKSEKRSLSILRIYRIQNIDVWNRYSKMREKMSEELGTDLNEQFLFHGTTDFETVCCICNQSFDSRRCGKHGTMWGEGSYFASTSKKSHDYTRASLPKRKRYIFMATVLVGRYTKGRAKLKQPPLYGTENHGVRYDSVVDSVEKPCTFVIFNNDQAYPAYLIEYCDKTSQSQSTLKKTQIKTEPKKNSSPESHKNCTLGMKSSNEPDVVVLLDSSDATRSDLEETRQAPMVETLNERRVQVGSSFEKEDKATKEPERTVNHSTTCTGVVKDPCKNSHNASPQVRDATESVHAYARNGTEEKGDIRSESTTKCRSEATKQKEIVSGVSGQGTEASDEEARVYDAESERDGVATVAIPRLTCDTHDIDTTRVVETVEDVDISKGAKDVSSPNPLAQTISKHGGRRARILLHRDASEPKKIAGLLAYICILTIICYFAEIFL